MKKKDEYYIKIGKAVCKGIEKSFSHPDLKIDMCPDFSNWMVLTLGRELYKFLDTKEAKKLFKELGE